jgi:hypothetical protein
MEMGIQVLPLIHQSQSFEDLEYGFTSKESVLEFLLKELPVGIVLFPSNAGLKAVVPMNRVPGIDIEQLSKNQAFRLLVHRDNRAFPQEGIQNGSFT